MVLELALVLAKLGFDVQEGGIEGAMGIGAFATRFDDRPGIQMQRAVRAVERTATPSMQKTGRTIQCGQPLPIQRSQTASQPAKRNLSLPCPDRAKHKPNELSGGQAQARPCPANDLKLLEQRWSAINPAARVQS